MNIYLIYGNNYDFIKREIKKITKEINDVIYYDLSNSLVDELLDDASCISMFDEKKVLIGENANFLTGSSNNLNHNLDYLEKYINNDNNSNIVILTVLSEKLDERKKIVKLLKQKANIIYKEDIDEKNLSNFVIKEFKEEDYIIDVKTANYFIDRVGKDISIILSEILKMKLYKDEDKIINKKDIDEISSIAFKDNIFELSDAIMKKNYKKIFSCYNDLMILKEEPTKIISLLGNQFLLVYQCKLLKNKSNNEIASILNVHPYRVKLALETDYLVYELSDILKKLYELDYNIKSGNIDKYLGLKNFLLHI